MDTPAPRYTLVPPGAGEAHWQPEPANGWIEVFCSPGMPGAPQGCSAGLQTLPPLGKIREHAHPAQTELFWFVEGEALARLDGVVRRVRKGSFLAAPPHIRHGFINDGAYPMTFMWVLVPAGLEDFFRAMGKPLVSVGEDPTPYPRPATAGAIEMATVFEELDPPATAPWDPTPITDPCVLDKLRQEAI